MKILVLGINGMLGHATMDILSKEKEWEIHGTYRDKKKINYLNINNFKNTHHIDIENINDLFKLFKKHSFEVVINCTGIVKQVLHSNSNISIININALFPHKLEALCREFGSRIIHPSTDCVFSGQKGFYKETDNPDSFEFYGMTKYLGEIKYGNSVTLRTSFFGHQITQCIK